MSPEAWKKNMSSKGFNCCQTVFSYFAKDLDLEEDQALRLVSAFGGGMGKGETCGVVVAAYLVLGYFYGKDNKNSDSGLLKEKTKAFDQEFYKLSPSQLCREILGQKSKEELRINPPCQGLEIETIKILEDMIKEE